MKCFAVTVQILEYNSNSTLFLPCCHCCRDLKWVVKGTERLETLVSISTDGVVLEWNLKKGLVVSTLMQLKKSGTVRNISDQSTV